MRTHEEAIFSIQDEWHTDLKRRDDNTQDTTKENQPISVHYAEMVQDVVDNDPSLSVNKHNAAQDLEIAISDYHLREVKVKGRLAVKNLPKANLTSTIDSFRNNVSIATFLDGDDRRAPNATFAFEKLNIENAVSLIIPDEVARVFHPTQHYHILVGNLVLYTMEAVHASSLGASLSFCKTGRMIELHMVNLTS